MGNKLPDLGDPLTPAERAVVAEIMRGGTSNKHIARALNLSDRTIESHFRRIFRKLGVHSRVEVVRLITTKDSVAS